MLKIEDVKVGDELECIDIDLYLDLDDEWRKSRLKIIESSLIVDHIYDGGGLSIKDCELCVPVSDFKYFKKKEQYTFDDLIDVVVQVWKDGFVNYVDLGNGEINIQGLGTIHANRGVETFNDAINDIKSLYKETFVIECEEDIKRIKIKSEVTLTNGNTFIVDNVSDKFITPSDSFDKLTILSLKGAKVEQAKG